MTDLPGKRKQVAEFLRHVDDLSFFPTTEEPLRGHRLWQSGAQFTSRDPSIRWASRWTRSWSRFYVLGAYDEGTIGRAKGRRAIEEGVELIRLPG